jgi:TRAP-type mannitol/chloroaromatic compound transport system substrate-binding protein
MSRMPGPLGALLSVLLLSLASLSAQAAKPVLLKMPVYVGTHLTGLGSTPKWLAEHINMVSGGQLKIKLYEPGRLIPPKEILQAVNAGQVNAGFTTPGFNSGVLGNKAAIFSAVPFGPDAPELLAWVYYGDGRKLWQQMYDKADINVHSIPCGILAPETSRACACASSAWARW